MMGQVHRERKRSDGMLGLIGAVQNTDRIFDVPNANLVDRYVPFIRRVLNVDQRRIDGSDFFHKFATVSVVRYGLRCESGDRF
jgi:hypothetical protein